MEFNEPFGLFYTLEILRGVADRYNVSKQRLYKLIANKKKIKIYSVNRNKMQWSHKTFSFNKKI